MMNLTYDVRVFKLDPRKNSEGKVTSYRVRWQVAGEMRRAPFAKRAQAESFRADLISAVNRGEGFDVKSGLPKSKIQTLNRMTWYALACDYADAKWKDASAKHRADIARVMTLTTLALLGAERGRPDDAILRRALTRYAYNTKQRPDSPANVGDALAWVERNTLHVEVLADEETLRRILDAITTKGDGKRMAAVTVKKYRGILHNALQYAVLRKALSANPLTGLQWIKVKAGGEVDRRSVLNPSQGRALVRAIGDDLPSGERLVAMFGSMLYCGLRPEEAVETRKDYIVLPPLVFDEASGKWKEPPEDDDWGELFVGPVSPEVARDWTDDGETRDTRDRPKHRAEGEVRGPIPIPPVQVRLYRAHLANYGTGTDGRLFSGVKADRVPGLTIRTVLKRARAKVLTDAEQKTPLVQRPYDLRHTCLSTWLNAGIAPQQVAEWAGNSVAVLLRIYAKCLVGQTSLLRKRISDALNE